MSGCEWLKDLFAVIQAKARVNRAKVAVGVQKASVEVFDSVLEAHRHGYARTILICPENEAGPQGVECVSARDPVETMVSMLRKGEVDAAVRGTLSAVKVIAELRSQFKVWEMLRIALLYTVDETPFFLAPVGVDEGETEDEMARLMEAGVRLHRRLGVEPKVSVLSGGRMEDWGRSRIVDDSMRKAEKLVAMMKGRDGFEVKTHGILIEEAVREGYTFIIAPSGIAGNLIFRTLVFLGGGGAVGAPYMGVPKPIIDVSRAMSNFSDAIALASALTKP